MKIAVIYPDWGSFPLAYRRRIPPLGPLAVAACIPEEHEVVFHDARLAPQAPPPDADLALISAMTVQIADAYRIAAHYRTTGTPVVLGGYHPTLMPAEARRHADSVVIGEAESVLPTLLADAQKDKLQPIYECRTPLPADQLPVPRRSLLKRSDYLPIDLLQTSRGCPLRCEFCTVPLVAGRQLRQRPLELLQAEIMDCRTHLFLVDDNLMLDKQRALQLCQLFEQTKRRWSGLGSIDIARDPHLVEAMAKSGCWLLYLDVGPKLGAELCRSVPVSGYVQRLGEYFTRLRTSGIKVIASFVFGHDHDTPEIFARVVDFVRQYQIEETEFLISTPYPRTRLRERLANEGRLLRDDWQWHDTAHAVFKPKRMTTEELEQGYRWAWRAFYGKRFQEQGNEFVVDTAAVFPDEAFA